MLLENIAWFLFGLGLGLLMATLGFFIIGKIIYGMSEKEGVAHNKAKIDEYLGAVQGAVTDELAKINAMAQAMSGQEISRLQFRDQTGALCEVEIVIDHDLIDQKAIDSRPDEITLTGTHRVVEDQGGKTEQFVFAGNAVHALREAGRDVAVDEIVRELLKSSGRI